MQHLPALIQAGVDSLKIEGRMKTLYYVAAVTRVYRAALDRYLADPHTYMVDPAWVEELDKVSHRPYDTGFLFEPEDRITSYNVCYTKLLRSGRLNRITPIPSAFSN